MAGKSWTASEDRRLTELSWGCPLADVSAALVGRSRRACYQRLAKLGRAVCRTPAARASRFRRLFRGRHSNSASKFKPGHTPWNKDQRGIHLSPQSEFRRGTLRGMAARKFSCVGWVVIHVHRGIKTRWIKVTNHGPPSKRWIPHARWVWLQCCGPIPAGYFIIHRDGNSLNDRRDNLAMVNRAGHLRIQRQRDPRMEQRRKAASVLGNKRSAVARQRMNIWRSSGQSAPRGGAGGELLLAAEC